MCACVCVLSPAPFTHKEPGMKDEEMEKGEERREERKKLKDKRVKKKYQSNVAVNTMTVGSVRGVIKE